MPENSIKPTQAQDQALASLLGSLAPTLDPRQFYFCQLADSHAVTLPLADIHMLYREAEGVTLIVSEEVAQRASLVGEGPFCCITCQVHSSLHAVGLTAALTQALTAQGISANVVAAHSHDHLFVPAQDADRALSTLTQLTK